MICKIQIKGVLHCIQSAFTKRKPKSSHKCRLPRFSSNTQFFYQRPLLRHKKYALNHFRAMKFSRMTGPDQAYFRRLNAKRASKPPAKRANVDGSGTAARPRLPPNDPREEKSKYSLPNPTLLLVASAQETPRVVKS